MGHGRKLCIVPYEAKTTKAVVNSNIRLKLRDLPDLSSLVLIYLLHNNAHLVRYCWRKQVCLFQAVEK